MICKSHSRRSNGGILLHLPFPFDFLQLMSLKIMTYHKSSTAKEMAIYSPSQVIHSFFSSFFFFCTQGQEFKEEADRVLKLACYLTSKAILDDPLFLQLLP